MTDRSTFAPNERVLNAYRRWTGEDDALLWRHQNLPISELVTVLGRKDSAIRTRLTRLAMSVLLC